MKKLKIALAIGIIISIIIAIIYGLTTITESGKIQPDSSGGPGDLGMKIDSLTNKPDSILCPEFYKKIKYFIDDSYRYKLLGKTQTENEQWKNNLSNRLYAAYANKFIDQSFYIFKHSEWEIEKIEFIRKERQDLHKEGFDKSILEENSITDQKFIEIANILTIYDNITGFVNTCNTYSFEDLTNEFPISTISEYVQQSKNYLDDNLGNEYVNNCSRLKSDLSNIPDILMRAHVKYLDLKIDSLRKKYNEYKSFPTYKKEIYDPLYIEVINLNNDVYNKDLVAVELSRLNNKLEMIGDEALLKLTK